MLVLNKSLSVINDGGDRESGDFYPLINSMN